jgi:hypothetical protein
MASGLDLGEFGAEFLIRYMTAHRIRYVADASEATRLQHQAVDGYVDTHSTDDDRNIFPAAQQQPMIIDNIHGLTRLRTNNGAGKKLAVTIHHPL